MHVVIIFVYAIYGHTHIYIYIYHIYIYHIYIYHIYIYHIYISYIYIIYIYHIYIYLPIWESMTTIQNPAPLTFAKFCPLHLHVTNTRVVCEF